jgi:hypothetical protein
MLPDGTTTALVILFFVAMAFTILGLCEHIARLTTRLDALEPAPPTRFAERIAEGVELAEPEPLAPPFLRWPAPEQFGVGFNRQLAHLWPAPPPARFVRQPKRPRPDGSVPLTSSVAAGFDRFTHGRPTIEMPAVA